MVSIDEMREILGELVDELPEKFFNKLNGGIIVQPQHKLHPKGIEGGKRLYIMAEYTTNYHMGRQIVFYYGSFSRVHGYKNREELKEELRSTLRHEFRHHVEGLGKLMDLELEDERQIQDYLK